MTSKELAYIEIDRLVKDFKNISTSKRKSMNEMQTRLGYILPLFKALEWDTSNINEVTPEEKVSRGWVDFSFRLGNVPRFFLETKRVDEDLNDPRWVKQAIDYAWTKSVTWALLSDFEGLRVFNAEWKESDPFRAQFFEFGIDDYLKDFERLWWLSKTETSARRLDLEAEKVGRKIKRLPVSQNLFDDLKTWRTNLFKNYRAFNPIFSTAQIDEAVLRLLNRLIFIRTAEDREVENNRLRSLVRELRDRKQIQKLDRELAGLFRELDGIYNSELFAKHFSEELKIPPTDLEEIINGLYEKNYTRYNFNALEADVLGTAYEQYLGHVVIDTPLVSADAETHVEEKRTKRKSQGIYYTPAFVTKYIVQQTVGKYLSDNGYNPSRPPRVLDMACGSGSFLIEAFDVIDDFVAKQRGEAQKSEVDFNDRMRQLEILRNCIYGVDKDKQAVEVARLNLLLRGLHSREKLPMLENIANGDSLKSDTYPFHFPKVMQEGGFDVIIGNPPYVRMQTLDKTEVDYFNQNFVSATGNYDIYILFVEQALKLLKPDGVLGLILPNKFFNVDYGIGLRKLISESKSLWKIIDFGDAQVFETATTYTCMLFLKKGSNEDFTFTSASKWLKEQIGVPVEMTNNLTENTYSQTAISSDVWKFAREEKTGLFDRLQNFSLLQDCTHVFQGLATSADAVYVLEVISENSKTVKVRSKALNDQVFEIEKEIIHPLLKGEEIARYKESKHINVVLFPYNVNGQDFELIAKNEFQSKYPLAFEYLKRNKDRLLQRSKVNPETYWHYPYPKNITLFTKPKILVQVLSKQGNFALDAAGKYFFVGGGTAGGNAIISDDISTKFLLAILNSKILTYYVSLVGSRFRGNYFAFGKGSIGKFPIKKIDFYNPTEKSTHDEIVSFVEKMLSLQKERQAVRPEDDFDHARNLDREIARVDSEIDQLVYALYGLTEEEIKIVEGK